jgi:hypothetical protein
VTCDAMPKAGHAAVAVGDGHNPARG